MRYLSKSVDDFDLVNRVYRRRKSAVDAKDLIVDDHTQCEEVEHVRKIVPDGWVAVFATAFCVEAI